MTNNLRTVFSVINCGAHTRASCNALLTLTAPTKASIIFLQAEAAPLRYTFDEGNTDPTADIGFLLAANSTIVRLDLYEDCVIKLIGNNAFVNYQWARPAANLY